MADSAYDRELEHLVDVSNYPYGEARAILGERPPENVGPDLSNVPSHEDTSPYHELFSGQATQLLNEIGGAEHKSQLRGGMIGSRIARLALTKAISPYEREALFVALRNRKEELTYRDRDPSEERTA